MSRPSSIIAWVIGGVALVALALWPEFIRHSESAARASSLPTMAPVTADYLDRDKQIAFWEGMVRKHLTGDTMSPTHLSSDYLQRYRERGDIGDVMRARRMAQLSLAANPRGNYAAEAELASVDLTLHRFKDALAITRAVEPIDPTSREMKVREASLDLEIGDYRGAKKILDALPIGAAYDISRDTLLARYQELTGHLAEARETLEKPAAQMNAQFDAPAQARAWFPFRAGEMAFEAGDNDTALADEDESLKIFPDYSEANKLKAKFNCALKHWQACLDAATASANVVPYPETLGYEADAQRALGNADEAKRIDDLIVTIEKIGNAQRISDRLLAIYYSEHGFRRDDAYAIAKRELAVRDDIFTEDTLAWAAVADGRWDEARIASAKAMRLHTENALLDYHAGIIALHFGDKEQAKDRLTAALALNPSFHQVYADDARAQIARL